jgi:hypothetical protein
VYEPSKSDTGPLLIDGSVDKVWAETPTAASSPIARAAGTKTCFLTRVSLKKVARVHYDPIVAVMSINRYS